MGALGSLVTLKRRLGIGDTSQDTLLADCLAAATGEIERWCDRTIVYAAADITEQRCGGGYAELRLRCWPITSVVSVKEAADGDFAAATALTQDGDYRVLERGRLVRLPYGATWISAGEFLQALPTVQIVYRGGYAGPDDAPVSGVATAPQNLQEACILQAAHLYQRRTRPGASSSGMAGPGGSLTFEKEYGLLVAVQELLRGERRMA